MPADVRESIQSALAEEPLRVVATNLAAPLHVRLDDLVKLPRPQ